MTDEPRPRVLCYRCGWHYADTPEGAGTCNGVPSLVIERAARLLDSRAGATSA